MVQAFYLGDVFDRRFADFFQAAEVSQQRATAYRAYTFYIVQDGAQAGASPQLTVVCNREAVSFISHADEQE